jgi:hypothetical protein
MYMDPDSSASSTRLALHIGIGVNVRLQSMNSSNTRMKKKLHDEVEEEEYSPLLNDFPCSHGIVTDFAISHITIARKSNGCAMSLDCAPSPRSSGSQGLDGGTIRLVDGIVFILLVLTPSV